MAPESFPRTLTSQETKEDPEFIEISGQRINLSEAKRAIPEFESLDPKTRELALLTWHLSTETREDFLEENPRLIPIIQRCQEYYHVVVMGNPKGFKDRLAKAKLAFTNLDATMDPRAFEDQKYYLADMFELVRLHILEQRDFERTEKRPGVHAVYSPETSALTRKILERFRTQIEKLPHLARLSVAPDAYCDYIGKINRGEIFDKDTAEQIKTIHKLISADHQYHRGIVPYGGFFIKDLWRFCAIKSDNFSEKRLREEDIGPWNAAGRSFYDGLASIDLKIDK